MIKKEINNNPNYNENIRENLLKFANHMEKKAKGEIWTDAKYIRKFINEHPKYNKDSIINLCSAFALIFYSSYIFL